MITRVRRASPTTPPEIRTRLAPATEPVQRPRDARLLVVDEQGEMHHLPRAGFAWLPRPGDLVVANDAATIPGSLTGTHVPTGCDIEVRLAGRRSLEPGDVNEFVAIVFGEGDHRIRTEERPVPPVLLPGDRLALGPLEAVILDLQAHPRFVTLRFAGSSDSVWDGLARHGRPIQYAHMPEPLALWDVWTKVAGVPAAFEPPSAGFVLDWRMLDRLRDRGVGFSTLTHAAGISSTGDPALDARFPLDEPYHIPAATAAAIERTHASGGRVIAVGTTVTRALEHAARESSPYGIRPGHGIADNRIGPGTTIRAVDAILTGTHEPGESHFALLEAFTSRAILTRISRELVEHAYRSHEFGDSVLLWRGGGANI